MGVFSSPQPGQIFPAVARERTSASPRRPRVGRSAAGSRVAGEELPGLAACGAACERRGMAAVSDRRPAKTAIRRLKDRRQNRDRKTSLTARGYLLKEKPSHSREPSTRDQAPEGPTRPTQADPQGATKGTGRRCRSYQSRVYWSMASVNSCAAW